MMKKIILICVIFFGLKAIGHAQQYPLFTNYLLNRFAFNPANDLANNSLYFNGLYRKQWVGLSESPETAAAGIRYGFGKIPVTIGAVVSQDKAGLLEYSGISPQFAYRIRFAEKTSLSLGASVGYTSLKLSNQILVQDANDPSTAFGKRSIQKPDTNLGLLFRSNGLELGVSSPYFANRRMMLQDTIDSGAYIRHYYGSVSYLIPISGQLKIEPSVLIKIAEEAPIQFDVGARFFLHKIWLGAQYRDREALSAGFGLRFPKMDVGYAFDMTLSGLRQANSGSHEIGIEYRLNFSKDSDGDGIKDRDDACPEVPGVIENLGCPELPKVPEKPKDQDKDKDGILDAVDKCPDVAGEKKFEGCPDSDQDGLPDDKDLCPLAAGLEINKGCPINDSDGDGILNDIDKCPNLAGPLENFGCPDADDDQDGVPNRVDICPNTIGLTTNGGCPIVTDEEDRAIQLAIENLYFDTDKADIRTEAFPHLADVAKVLASHPDWKVRIDGHTDSRSSAEYNEILSQRRAKAAFDYLVEMGARSTQLVLNHAGEKMPVARNDSEMGMQRNRRVELRYVFD